MKKLILDLANIQYLDILAYRLIEIQTLDEEVQIVEAIESNQYDSPKSLNFYHVA